MVSHTRHLVSTDRRLSADLSCESGILSELLYTPTTESSALSVLYRAPWLTDMKSGDDQPPLMRRLAGEWVGVPFGCVTKDDGTFMAQAPHGLPANGIWHWEGKEQPDKACLAYDYPSDHPLQRVERCVELGEEGVVRFSLAIHARKKCRLPIGLHPIFPVGGAAGDIEISVTSHGMTYPVPTEPNVSRLATQAHFQSLAAVPTAEGKTLDLRRLPLPFATEEIVQLLAPTEGIGLVYPQRGLRIDLSWDTQILPHCLLWISNGGRAFSPWDGRNYCLGVEPIRSAWDLGPASAGATPISIDGEETTMPFSAGETVFIQYQLRCSTFAHEGI